MKATILSVLLFPSLLIAQTTAQTGRPGSAPPPHPRQPPFQTTQEPADALPDNYQLTLSIADKEGLPFEVSVVVASRQFSAQISEPSALVFSGTLALEDGGALVVSYALSWETPILVGNGNTQFKPSSTKGSVRLNAGEEIQLLRAGNRTARLSIKKVEASKPK